MARNRERRLQGGVGQVGQFTADRGLDVDGVIGHHVLRHDRGELFAVCAAQGARRLREG